MDELVRTEHVRKKRGETNPPVVYCHRAELWSMHSSALSLRLDHPWARLRPDPMYRQAVDAEIGRNVI